MFNTLAFVLFIAAFVPYWITIVNKKTKPAKATWSIWAAVDTLICVGMMLKHTENGQIIAAVVCASITAALSIKFGSPGWTKTDKQCFAGAILGVALWAILQDPLVGQLISLGVLYLGAYPMLKGAEQNPSQESKLVWILFVLSSVFQLIGMQKDSISAVSEPITFMVIDSLMLSYVLMPQTSKTM